MNKKLFLVAGAAALVVGSHSANATLLFGFEPGSEELPTVGNPAFAFSTGLSTTTGVTQGTQALSVTQSFSSFGGPGSPAFTDATAATLIDAATSLNVDLTVPTSAFNYGNIDIHFFQGGSAISSQQSQETNFSPTFALAAPGSTITLSIPLTRQDAAPGTKVLLDPTLAFSFQIDFSDGPAVAFDGTNPATFYVDNISTPAPIPEPASLGLLGLAGGFFLKRRSR